MKIVHGTKKDLGTRGGARGSGGAVHVERRVEGGWRVKLRVGNLLAWTASIAASAISEVPAVIEPALVDFAA